MNKVHLIDSKEFENGWNKDEEYVGQVGDAVWNYIKYGIKSELLNEFISVENDFRRRYRERLSKQCLIHELKGLTLEIVKDYSMETENKSKINQERVDVLLNEKIEKYVSNTYQKVIIDTAYISHMNMMYNLLEKEQKLRNEQEKYEKIARELQELSDIAKCISESRRLELKSLQGKMKISEKTILDILQGYGEYFNIRERKDAVEISLSAEGRKFNKYMTERNSSYIVSAMMD